VAAGLTINQSLSGSAGATNWNSINISSDNVAGAFLCDLNLTHSFGGSAATGGRCGYFGWLIQTAATNVSNSIRAYEGMTGVAQSNSGDGGTNTGAGALGAYYGANFIGRNGGINVYEVNGVELDVMTTSGASQKYVFGLAVANYCATQGAVTDAGVIIYSGGSIAASGGSGPWGPGVGFKNGILFAELESNGRVPISASGTVLGASVTSLSNIPVTNGIDLRNFSISGQAFASNGFGVDGSGNLFAAGGVVAYGGAAVPAGGTSGVGFKMSSVTNLGVFFGSGVPTLSAAQGSLYLRSDGNSTSTRMYINTNGSTGWTNVVTAA
jgi:hypothetical protein